MYSSMDMDLSPMLAKTFSEGDGGSYYTWSSSDHPVLAQFEVGAGKVVLQPRGFALPHYADSFKMAYVLQGSDGIVGLITSKSTKESVYRIRKGDIITIPLGSTSWWFNDGDSELVIIFLGKTPKAYVPGDFSYFFITGALGMLSGFSTEFTSRILGMNEEKADAILNSQKAALITKLEEGKTMPQPHTETVTNMVYNIEDTDDSLVVKNGGSLSVLTAANFPALEQVGLSACLVKLNPNAMYAPIYTTDASIQVTYVSQGSGKIQIVGLNGQSVLDAEARPGQLIVVPRFFSVAIIAGDEGMQCITILTSAEPIVEELGSKLSVLAALSPAALEASLNVSPEITRQLQSKIRTQECLIPPSS